MASLLMQKKIYLIKKYIRKKLYLLINCFWFVVCIYIFCKAYKGLKSVKQTSKGTKKQFSDFLSQRTDENFVFANMTPDINDALKN